MQVNNNKADFPNHNNLAEHNGETEDELEGDLYLLALQKRLFQMKKERKKTDQDAQLLKNRLNLLKGEEDKVSFTLCGQTWKKVEGTRKKTQEKLASMQKQEETFNLKQSIKEKREMEILLQKEINNKLKNDIKGNIETKKEKKMQQIKEEALIIKEQKRVNITFIFQ